MRCCSWGIAGENFSEDAWRHWSSQLHGKLQWDHSRGIYRYRNGLWEPGQPISQSAMRPFLRIEITMWPCLNKDVILSIWKERIRGGNGHLSNTPGSLEIFTKYRASFSEAFSVSHLSEQNNKILISFAIYLRLTQTAPMLPLLHVNSESAFVQGIIKHTSILIKKKGYPITVLRNRDQSTLLNWGEESINIFFSGLKKKKILFFTEGGDGGF